MKKIIRSSNIASWSPYGGIVRQKILTLLQSDGSDEHPKRNDLQLANECQIDKRLRKVKPFPPLEYNLAVVIAK